MGAGSGFAAGGSGELLLKRSQIGLMLAVLLALLSSCALSPPPPASTKNPPLYPGAQSVVSQTTYYGSFSVQTLTYQAQASPETIGGFYKTALGIDSWEYQDSWSSPTNLHFAWANKQNLNTPVFELMVVIDGTETP